MAESIRDLFLGGPPLRALVETITPRRTFEDVVLPPETRAALDHALQLVRKNDLLLRAWGLGERHTSGLGLAFHFAGPPGTGKTICAEALAHALGRQMLVVRYSGIESRWAGQTAKHLETVFEAADKQDAVLFFDEADAIAGRRFATATAGYEREANSIVNVLLHELERSDGVVIFATNLAAGIDPAFERRIRTHVLFQLPGPVEREKIWRAQIHPQKTPLADDVDFRALAEEFARSGGDIKNAVLKGAQLATLESVPDPEKRIHQRHFEQGMREVVAGGDVMAQSLFDEGARGPGGAAAEQIAEVEDRLQGEIALVTERIETVESKQSRSLERIAAGGQESETARRGLEAKIEAQARTMSRLTWLALAALLAALSAIGAMLYRSM
ncbi:MAG: ATP-binding protein [Gemmatimonadota bacterium]